MLQARSVSDIHTFQNILTGPSHQHQIHENLHQKHGVQPLQDERTDDAPGDGFASGVHRAG